MPTPLSVDDVERMREIVLRHDASRTNETREFDLNKPITPPYKHQAFPTTVYNHKNGRNRIVKTAAELDKLTAAGWQRKPAAPIVAAKDPTIEAAYDDDDLEVETVAAAAPVETTEKPRAKRAGR